MKPYATYRDLKKEDKERLFKNKVSPHAYNVRMRRGWDKNDAIHLPKVFNTVDGEIRRTFMANGKIFFMYPSHYYQMKANNLTDDDLIKRIRNGADLDMAVTKLQGQNAFDDKPKPVRTAPMRKRKAKKTYADILFEQSCKQFLEVK